MAHLGILPTMNMNSRICFTMTLACRGVSKRTTMIPLTGTTHDFQHKKRLQARKGTFLGFRDPQATLWTALSKLWNSATKQKKSTRDWKVKPTHIFQMVKDYGGFFTPLDSKNLKMGGVGHLQIPKKKSQLGPNGHVTQKPEIFYIFQTLHFLAKITPPLASKHLKMGG